MKIVADADIPFVKEAFAEFGPVLAVPGREITRHMVRDASILLVRSVSAVDADILEGSKVGFVGTATIGFDHVDTSYLKEHGIGFASAPGSNANSVAEYVVAALLELARAKRLDHSALTLGIVGVGNVGSRVLALAQTLGMRCLLNDPPKQRMSGSDIFLPLEEVLGMADVVTVHVPLAADGPDATVHMVDKQFLGRMKEGAVLINTSRGKVVDEAALRAGRARMGGFVADVWEGEPAIDIDTMAVADIATPHIAGYSFDGKVRGVDMIHQAACAFYFRDRKWHPGRHLDPRHTTAIDAIRSKDIVYDAVESAYAIMHDDSKLRRIAGMKYEKRGEYFDTLRREYPKRREFAHFAVKTGDAGDAAIATLRGLGFTARKS